MIVRESLDSWKLVLQPDHGILAGEIAAKWADTGPQHSSLVTAARRHDDGWAVWECSPQVDDSGRPIAVFDVDIRSHLAFYRAGIAAISEEDPYAGLLVSMHGAGIYQHRYGTDPDLVMAGAAKAQAEVDAFVTEQEASNGRWAAELGVDDDQRWADYHRLQWCDRLSLAICFGEVDNPTDEPLTVGDFTLQPVAARHFRISPNPFTDTITELSFMRRSCEKLPFSQQQFVDYFKAREPELVRVQIEG